MTTAVLSLPAVSGALAFPNNADVGHVWTLGVDLTGIAFHMQVRLAADETQIALEASTGAGTLVNGGTAGTLTLAVPASAAAGIAPGAYVADILAAADGHVVNLCGASPLAVTVTQGVTV